MTAGGDQLWRIEDHVCLVCLGRVLSRREYGERRLFACSNCGARASGKVQLLCACGAKVGTRNAGIRCVPNPTPTPACPALIVTKEIP